MQIDYFDWMEQYKPMLDPSQPDPRPLDVDPRLGFDIETFHKAVQENRVWTLVDGDGEEEHNEHGEPIDYTTILTGFHRVNRLEHYITEVPWTSENFEVK